MLRKRLDSDLWSGKNFVARKTQKAKASKTLKLKVFFINTNPT